MFVCVECVGRVGEAVAAMESCVCAYLRLCVALWMRGTVCYSRASQARHTPSHTCPPAHTHTHALAPTQPADYISSLSPPLPLAHPPTYRPITYSPPTQPANYFSQPATINASRNADNHIVPIISMQFKNSSAAVCRVCGLGSRPSLFCTRAYSRPYPTPCSSRPPLRG